MRSETCQVCGEEVRFGDRAGRVEWLHRGDPGHHVILGRASFQTDWEEVRREMHDVVRLYDDGSPYTTAEHDIRRDNNAERRRQRLAELFGEDPDAVKPLPPPEVLAQDIDPDTIAPRSGIRRILNTIAKSGWELVSLTGARGPYLGAAGGVLSISDSILIRARGPVQVDGTRDVAVASWRDGAFDFASVGSIRNGQLSPRKVDAKTLANWIKGAKT